MPEINYTQVAAGIALLSPLDEIIVSSLSGGVGLTVAPAQAVIGAVVGLFLIFNGMFHFTEK